MRLRPALLALTVASLGACHGNTVSYVYVKVLAPPTLSGATLLRSVLTNDGQVAGNDFAAVEAGALHFPTSFTIELSAGRSGHFDLEVDALDGNGVLLASGHASFRGATNVEQVDVMLFYPLSDAGTPDAGAPDANLLDGGNHERMPGDGQSERAPLDQATRDTHSAE